MAQKQTQAVEGVWGKPWTAWPPRVLAPDRAEAICFIYAGIADDGIVRDKFPFSR